MFTKMQKCKNVFVTLLVFTMIISLASPLHVKAEQVNSETVNPATVEANEVTEPVEQEQPDNASGEEVSGRAFDINLPVLESITLEQQAQTLKVGDKVKIVVDAYDADSGIKSVVVSMQWDLLSLAYLNREAVELTYNSDTKKYETEYLITEKISGRKCYIGGIEITDNATNKLSGQQTRILYGENNQPLYYFFVDGIADDEKPQISEIVFKQQGKEVKLGDTLEFEAKITDNIGLQQEQYASASFKQTNDDVRECNFMLEYDETSEKYKGQITVTNLSSGKWTLARISAEDLSGNSASLPAEASDIWFTVIDGSTDTEKPEITSIELDKQGKVLEPGDTVKVQLGATDNVGVSWVSVNFSTGKGSDTYLNLQLNQDTGKYEGELKITKEMYPTEWYISNVNVSDSSNNYADIRAFNADFYIKNPYYFSVQNDGTLAIPTFDMTVNVHVPNAKGQWSAVETKQLKNIKKRTTIKEALGSSFPNVNTNVEGLTFCQWEDTQGNPIDENMQILNSSSLNFYAGYDKAIVNVDYSYLTADGVVKKFDSKVQLVVRGTKYKEVIENAKNHSLPENSYNGMQPTEWISSSQHIVEDQQIMRSGHISMEPNYDEKLVRFSYGAIDAEGNLKYTTENKLFPRGTTYEQAVQEGKKKAPNTEYSQIEFTGWEPQYKINNGQIGNYSNISMIATYKNHAVVAINYSYYGQDGMRHPNTVTQIVEKGKTTYEQVVKKAKENRVLDHYQGLRFSEWVIYNMSTGVINEPYFSLYSSAGYENCIVRFLVDNLNLDMYSDLQYEKYGYSEMKVVEKGTMVSVPKEIKGYKNVKWSNYNILDFDASRPFLVNNSIDINGMGEKIETEKPDPEPENPTPEPENPTPSPGIPLDPGKIEQTVEDISKVEAGGQVIVSMGEATVISEQILEAAKGKDVNVVLNMGGYTWTINGQDILSNNLKAINLEVKIGSNAIADDILKQVAGDNPVKQLSLSHNGDFGFKASLTVNMGAEYTGKYGNLFYHDSSGKMVYMNAGTIDTEGNVTLGFSHASDYAVVIADKVLSEIQVPGGETPQGPSVENPTLEGKDITDKDLKYKQLLTPKTGDNTSAVLYGIVMGMMLILIAGIVWNKKYCKKK